ncbi:hypothetical protein EIP86_001688 [Pleurotus ostreatoroseus]|nr:hypothetical protein EIP86_001688 [Pleurotus ostreatoroseus]
MLQSESTEALREEITRKHAQYERELHRIQGEMRELRSQLNATALIAHLPADILSLVFEAYRAELWKQYKSQSKEPHQWLGILHVCRSWRHIALSTPRLWTKIVPTSAEYVDFAISHSGRLPLTVALAEDATIGEDVVQGYEQVLRDFARLRSLELRMHPAAIRSFFVSENSHQLHAPFMESIELSFPLDPDDDDTLPVISNSTLPQLASLTVKGDAEYILYSMLRPTLRHLGILRFTHMQPSELLRVLDHLPVIQELQIEHDIEHDFVVPNGAPIPAPSRTVTLPRLKRVILREKGLGRTSVRLLTHLDMPPDVSISLFGVRGGFDEYYLDKLFSALSPKLSRPGIADSGILNPLSIEMGYAGLHYFLLWPTKRTWHDQKQESGEHQHRLQFLDKSSSYFPMIASALLEHFDTSRLVSLKIYQPINFFQWESSLRYLSALQTLHIQLPDTAVLLMEVFSVPIACQSELSGSEIESTALNKYFLPALQDLTLVGVSWRQKHDCSLEGDFLPQAIMLLKGRMANGFGISVLRIMCPKNLSENDARLFDDPHVVGQCIVTRDAENDPSTNAG